MRLATWNINSLRTRMDRLVAMLERHQIDVCALQEIKCRPDQVDLTPLHQAGYEVTLHGVNQWNGVALLSRVGLERVRTSFPEQPSWSANDDDEPVLEPRALGATCAGIDVWSLYIPNGRELTHPHYTYKLSWLDALTQATTQWLTDDPDARIALVGDWNVARTDDDVWDMAAFEGATHVSPAERNALARLEHAGMSEVTRERVTQYTYWDYQRLCFPKNKGMRIDYVYASPALAAQVSGAMIDRDERKGKGASDHVPVIVDIEQ